MKKSSFRHTLGLLSMAAAFAAAPAFGASVSYYLDQTNINASPFPDGTNYVKVTISDGVGGNIDFLVEALAVLDSAAGANYGIDSFGFNTTLGSVTSANIVNLPSGWSVSANSNQDGFGNFGFVVNGTGSNRIDPLMFSISGIAGDTPMDYVAPASGNAAEGNFDFAAHVAGFSSQYPPSAYFGGSSPVPEADTWGMMLLGVGLVSLRLRRRASGVHQVRA